MMRKFREKSAVKFFEKPRVFTVRIVRSFDEVEHYFLNMVFTLEQIVSIWIKVKQFIDLTNIYSNFLKSLLNWHIIIQR